MLALNIASLIVDYTNCKAVREYQGIFPHLYYITFLVAAVSAH